MIDETLTPLNDEERDRLARARLDVPPPRALEERTVAALRERGLIRPPRRRWIAAGVLAAAAALLLVAALWTARPRPAVAPSAASGPRYMLLLYAGVDPLPGSADTRRREYSQWARDVASSGVAITGEELAEDGHEVGASASPPLALPRGFFIVDAPDLASAERIASTCPHLRHGGRIVIKPIV